LPPLFANADSRDYAMDVVKAIISGLTLIGTAIAAIGLFLSYSQNQERLITERFAKAVEQLGTVNSVSKRKEETVRIGGIYSLERIAKDSPKDHWTIMEVLTSYVRKESPAVSIQAPLFPDLNSSPEEAEKQQKKWNEWIEKNKVTIDVQAALTAIRRRNDDNDNYSDKNFKELDLSKSNLIGANLIDVENLTPAQIKSACNWEEAIYKGDWDWNNDKAIVDKVANQKYIESLKQDKTSNPQEPVNCIRWK
jgi:hypothetical protein